MIIKHFKKRVEWLSILALLVVFVLILRVGYLQLLKGDYYSRLADGNRIRLVPAMAPRGLFYDRNGNLLVSNRPGFSVSLLSLNEPIKDEVVERLAKLLAVDKKEIQDKLKAHSGFDPIHIKSDVGPEIIAVLEERKDDFPGVSIDVQPIRSYINKELAAHVFGYVSEINDEELKSRKDDNYRSGDIIGKFGLEKLYDKDIRGLDGGGQVEVDVMGKPIQILGKKEPIPGNNLILTIDENIQKATEKAIDEQLAYLQKYTEYKKAQAAAAIVMNPNTGEILALVSRPAFNPNLFAVGISNKEWKLINDNPYYPLDNKAVTGEYPPGSTFKVVTGAAALEEGKVTAEEKILDTGKHWIIPKVNAGGEALGWINFREALSKSDNVYFYEMGNRLGIDAIERYARMFGLGAKTGINLPYEAEGLVANREYKRKVFEDEWYLSETFDAAIGQGFNLVTPLQVAVMYSQIANGGVRYRPYLVRKITDYNGNTIKEFKPDKLGQLSISKATMNLLRESLRDVARQGGTAGHVFDDFPIPISGKTGTSENPHGADHSWFVAYGPYENPQYVVVVIVDQGGYGAASAVPIGKKVLEAAFGLNQAAVPQ